MMTSHTCMRRPHLNKLSAGPPHTRWKPDAKAANWSATLPDSSHAEYSSTNWPLLAAVTAMSLPPGSSSAFCVAPKASYSTSNDLDRQRQGRLMDSGGSFTSHISGMHFEVLRVQLLPLMHASCNCKQARQHPAAGKSA
eukprot:GHRQ01026076.1.p1 GENE.GHRQ01026076.1~~GHRQ01026076.1.p1  ORF type:complete len:139 (+),score=14.63 GHRQ01026076.1:234-650(+)